MKPCPMSLHPRAPTATGIGNYGRITVRGRRVYEHRLAFCVANSIDLDDIEGLVVRHRCDNPPCREPSHLELGTQADNVADRVRRGRQPRGETSYAAKLTDAIVRLAKRLHAKGVPQRRLAALFGVSAPTLHKAIKGKTWKANT